MKVKATKYYKELNIKDKELDKIPEEGEQFEVTVERYNQLTNNGYNVKFVERVVEKKVEVAVKKEKTEKAVRKTTTRKKIK